jgi:5'(3')-deoxyribonucleotidase
MKTQDPNRIVLGKSKKKEGLIIFADIDGVIAFWEKSAAKILGIDLNDKQIRQEIKNGKKIETYVGGDSVMWPKISAEGPHWWRDIEILPWGKKLYEELTKKTDYFCFLTSPSNNPSCAAGKVEFLQKHFGENFKDFLIGRNKHFCASHRSLLIDDNKDKIEKFRSFGGHVYQWPNPFVFLDGDDDSDKRIEELLIYIDGLLET